MGVRERRWCARCCGSDEGALGGLPEGWSSETEDDGTMFLCPTCTRANLRAIEARLDQQWWE